MLLLALFLSAALFSVFGASNFGPDVVFLNQIFVDGQLGNDSSACLQPNNFSRPCKSLTYALQGYRNDSTLYTLTHGVYTLESTLTPFINLDTLGIYGDDSMVLCEGNAGLAFENIFRINITNVTFSGCGAFRNSTSRNYSDSDQYSVSTFKVGLYFYLCYDVMLNGIVVANSSDATGVVMYDTGGINFIVASKFYNNSVLDPATSSPGGGGFYMEFTYCTPVGYCNDTSINTTYNSESIYTFLDCTFHNNVATDATSEERLIIPYQESHVAFGRGGGLSLFFNGNSSNNLVNVFNSNFTNNHALYGGGLFVQFQDNAVGNTVGVFGCIFQNNNGSSAGGGIHVGHFVLQSEGTAYNNVTIVVSNFSFNDGMYGGGMSIEPALQETSQASAVSYFLIQGCQFVSNVATLGSAIYVSLFTLITSGLTPVIVFNHTLVLNNTMKTVNPYDSYGAVHIHLVPVNFQYLIRFDNNTGSALALVATHANFTSCRAEFFGNSGPKGAAIALLGASWLLIGSETIMRFENNIATIDGGAIYNLYIEKENFSTNTNCFIKYIDPTLPPESWTAHFIFINNSDSTGRNSIHSTSILPCGALSSYSNQSQIFCWNGRYWNYNGSSCADQISTDASHVSFASVPAIYPGQITQLPLSATDDLDHDVLRQTVFIGFINDSFSALSPQFTYLSSGYVQISGNASGNTTLSLSAAGNSALYGAFTIEVIGCPPGLKPSSLSKNATCVCDSDPRTGSYGGLLLCLGSGSGQANNGSAPPALLQQGYWIGVIDNNSGLVAGPCPPGYCDGADSNMMLGMYIKLPLAANQLNEVICSGNRTGILCGECKKGHSPAINSYTFQCLTCSQSDSAANILKYFGVVYVPLIAFFILIILFKIRLTAGVANVLILYSQVISSTFDLTVPENVTRAVTFANTLTISYRFVYGILNLDFFSNLLPPFCIYGLNTLDIISLNYIVALSPLLMILITFVSIKLVNVRCVRCCAKCRISASPMMAFASFLLLSYNKLTLTSTSILSEVQMLTSNGTSSGYTRAFTAGQYSYTDSTFVNHYAVVAYFFLVIPVLLPIVLLGYPVHYMEKMVNKIPFLQKYYPADKVNIFLDTFQGDFRDNRRFYASFYFLFRLVIAVEFIVAVNAVTQMIFQQGTCIIMILLVAFLKPYKRRFLNYVDLLMFTNMAVLGSLSLYMFANPQLSAVPFALQYILIVIPPIVYAGVYIAWKWGLPCQQRLPPGLHLGGHGARKGVNTAEEKPRPPPDDEDDEDDVLISRSREKNSYTQMYDSVTEGRKFDDGH